MLDGALTQVSAPIATITSTRQRSSEFTAIRLSATTRASVDKLGYLATYRFATPMFWRAKHTVSGLVEQERRASAFRRLRRRSRDGTSASAPVAPSANIAASSSTACSVTAPCATTTTTVRRLHDLARRRLGQPARDRHAAARQRRHRRGAARHVRAVRLGAGMFIGNPNLKPEELFGWDAGVEFTLVREPRVRRRDLLPRRPHQRDRRASAITLINLDGESKRRGVELACGPGSCPWLSSARATPTSTPPSRFGPRKSAVRRTAPGAPTSPICSTAAEAPLTSPAIYNGDMKDRNFGTFPATVVTLDDYWLVSSALTYTLQPGRGAVRQGGEPARRRTTRRSPATTRRNGGVRRREAHVRWTEASAALGEVEGDQERRQCVAAISADARPRAAACRLRDRAGAAAPQAHRLARPVHRPAAGRPGGPRDRIAAVTHLAADPAVSAIPEKARGLPSRTARPRTCCASIPTWCWQGHSAYRPRSICCSRLGRRVVVVPLPPTSTACARRCARCRRRRREAQTARP